MKSIFIGLIFLLFHFNINLGNVVIQLFPDFIGYIFILVGLRKINDVNRNFEKIRPVTIGMCIYSSIIFVASFFDLPMTTTSIWIILFFSFVSYIITFYILYTIIRGVDDIEIRRGCDLNATKLKKIMTIIVISILLTIFLTFFNPFIRLLVLAVSWVAVIIFLVVFYKTTKLYAALPLISCDDCNN